MDDKVKNANNRLKILYLYKILIDKTKLTPARILVIFVTTGAILGGLGIYKYLVDFAGAGAAVSESAGYYLIV